VEREVLMVALRTVKTLQSGYLGDDGPREGFCGVKLANVSGCDAPLVVIGVKDRRAIGSSDCEGRGRQLRDSGLDRIEP